MSLFNVRGLAEIRTPEQFPGERLIACRNHWLAAERTHKREYSPPATERELLRIQGTGPLRAFRLQTPH